MQGDLAEDASTVETARLDGYALGERIGEGGMGVVHRATDARGRTVAVKLLRPHVASDAESRARFAREVRVLARVRGRHVAQVLDADVAAATPYLVTDFVAGPSLHEVVESDQPLTGAELADLAGDLADALCSIHAAGVVHRDLKPGNVLIEDGIAVVIDFGIAQIADDTRLTMPGLVYGTPGYVAPEILGGGEVTSAADIHAWAATVAYAVTGRAPFGKGPLEAVALRVLRDEPDLAGCPDWLLPVLQRCFAKNPAERPTAPELLRWLETGEPPAYHQVPGVPARGFVVAEPHPHIEPVTAALATQSERHEIPFDGAYPHHAPAEYPQEFVPIRHPEEYDDERDFDEVQADEVEATSTFAPQRDAQSKPHWIVTVLAFGTLGALAAFVPLVAAAGLVGWLLLARTVDRSASFVERRHAVRGRRRLDPVAATMALPWHLARSALVTVLALPVALVGASLLVGVVTLFLYAGGIGPRWDVICGGAGLVTAVLSWWGVQGEGVQRGSGRTLGFVLRRRWVAVGAAAVLVMLILLFLTAATSESVWWWPLDKAPLSRFNWPG
ncbi:serine/threonine-protein kinase [Actinopolymorpha alba]|uniref:serine/threonine-protein kinase n=1 Tax=Actinopolymorpha alba TaxID=533267 RepID=UPI0003AA302E|nr:serine/threonine-protein kinase [Actinopolymorpha alba]